MRLFFYCLLLLLLCSNYYLFFRRGFFFMTCGCLVMLLKYVCTYIFLEFKFHRRQSDETGSSGCKFCVRYDKRTVIL